MVVETTLCAHMDKVSRWLDFIICMTIKITIIISFHKAISQEELLNMVETQSEIIQKFKDECGTLKEKSISNQQMQG